MKRIVTFATATAITTLFVSTAALADDYNSGVVTKAPSEVYTDVEFGSGWYLRGDISYNIDGRNDSGLNSVSLAGSSSIQTDYDDAVGARIGVGYYLTPNFRVEANLESIFSSEINGLGAANFSAIGLDPSGAFIPITTGGTREVDAEYSISSLMASGNLDLGRFGAFTPYVGAGIGISRVEYDETETLTCVPFASVVSCSGFPSGAPGEVATVTTTTNEAEWTYAYQLTVGTAVAVTEKTSLDFSYSFTQIGDGDTISYADGTAIDEDGVRLHQLRAGLRYDIW